VRRTIPKRLVLLLLLAAIPAGPARVSRAAPPDPAPEAGWTALDEILGQSGRNLPGGVHRYGWPRTDLHVSLAGISIEPALALGSWAAFQATGNGDEAVAMGDLVLLGSEVNAVVGELHSNGMDVLAIHNHLIDESPRVVYVHFYGRGEAAALARSVKATLQKTRTPLASAPPRTPVKPSPSDEKAFEAIQTVLGRRGSLAGKVLQFSIPRAEKIEEGGMEIPPGMGVATAVNFQLAGSRAATTGDFVLVADEVNPVIRELAANGIAATALHSHMLREEPRLFFLHFWGVGGPDKVAHGIRAALEKVATHP